MNGLGICTWKETSLQWQVWILKRLCRATTPNPFLERSFRLNYVRVIIKGSPLKPYILVIQRAAKMDVMDLRCANTDRKSVV